MRSNVGLTPRPLFSAFSWMTSVRFQHSGCTLERVLQLHHILRESDDLNAFLVIGAMKSGPF